MYSSIDMPLLIIENEAICDKSDENSD